MKCDAEKETEKEAEFLSRAGWSYRPFRPPPKAPTELTWSLKANPNSHHLKKKKKAISHTELTPNSHHLNEKKKRKKGPFLTLKWHYSHPQIFCLQKKRLQKVEIFSSKAEPQKEETNKKRQKKERRKKTLSLSDSLHLDS